MKEMIETKSETLIFNLFATLKTKIVMSKLKKILTIFSIVFMTGVIAKPIQNVDNFSSVYIQKSLSMDRDGNSIGCNPYTEYYATGQIKEVGCQGYFHGQGTSLGMTYEYDQSGKLFRTTYYHPDEFEKDYKIVREYDRAGNVMSEKIFNNDMLYETEENELKEIPQ